MRMKVLTVLSLTLFFVAPLIAATRASIDDEIAELTRRIEAERTAVDQLSAPWRVPSSLALGLSAAPVVSLVRSLNTLPAPERTINFAVDAHNGQLWGWDAGCALNGHESEYVEFADPNYRVEASAGLSAFDAEWVPNQGLRFAVSGNGQLGIGTIHWHKDPCIGGGVGGHAGPATCNGNARLTTLARLSLGSDRILRYDASLNLNAIQYNCAIDCGDIGDIEFGSLVPSPQAASFRGALPLPLSTSGVLVSPDPKSPLRKEYEVQLIAPSLAITATGVDVGTDVAVRWK